MMVYFPFSSPGAASGRFLFCFLFSVTIGTVISYNLGTFLLTWPEIAGPLRRSHCSCYIEGRDGVSLQGHLKHMIFGLCSSSLKD